MAGKRWRCRVDFDNYAEIIERADGTFALTVPDDMEASFGELTNLAWELLHQTEPDPESPYDDEITYEFCGVEKCFRLLESNLATNICCLFLYCRDGHPDDLADFHAGRLLGLIQRDFFEHQRQIGEKFVSNGLTTSKNNRRRAVRNRVTPNDLLAALHSTQPKYAGQKTQAIKAANVMVGIKSYSTTLKLMTEYEIDDSQWLMK